MQTCCSMAKDTPCPAWSSTFPQNHRRRPARGAICNIGDCENLVVGHYENYEVIASGEVDNFDDECQQLR